MAGVRLDQLCDLVAVQVDPARHEAKVYVGLEHLASGRFTRSGHGSPSDVQSSKFAFRAGDVLYGKLRPYLDKAVLTEDEGICTTELLVLRPKADVDPRFLVGVVHSPSFVEHAVSGTTGVQHPRTSWQHISSFELPDFRLDEKKAIGGLLWKVHDGLIANEQAISAGDDLKRAAMRALFTKGLRGEAQKDTEIGPVPESWEIRPLEEVAEIYSSSRLGYGELLAREEQPESEPSHSVLGIKVIDMTRCEPEVLLSDAELKKLVPQPEAERRCIAPGAIVFPKNGAAVATNKKRRVATWCVLDPNVMALHAKGGMIQDFLYQWMLNFDLKSIVKPGPVPNFGKGDISGVPVQFPRAVDEQREIVAMLDAIDRKIDLHKRKRAVLEELFKSLLHKLMTGEIRVADLDLSALETAEPEGAAA